MERNKLYTVTKASSDNVIRLGDLIWLSENDVLNSIMYMGTCLRENQDVPGQNDFQVEPCEKFHLGDCHGVPIPLSIIGVFEISRGTVAASLLSAREILIRMLIVGATHFLICHNHPSGHLQPSKYDVDSTKNIVNAGRTIGIPLVDHLIIGDGRYVSLLEEYGKELFG